MSIFVGNTKATTNSAKSNDDTDKNAKKTNDDSVEPGKGTALGEIPKIEKYIVATRIDGLQTLYQVCRLFLFVCSSLLNAVLSDIIQMGCALSLDLLSIGWQDKCGEETSTPI